ncbi:unnamed protein product [Nippostrongylus brasiliensis]|uniref:Alpha N-terminal protein methyltransferase 1 n=1 Tax=Nippostrongylus brasiliensis TaxID=27835 RepID=A0A0N4YQV4_NIPBR|nr:unnamed protein product [Nippostrongylus brasiliensis]
MAVPDSKSDPQNAEEIYKKAEEFWSNASKDIDGMLGGFASLHTPDIRASKTFINKLRAKNFLSGSDCAADCGAGIGRVTKHLLLPLFKNVVMVEPVAELLEKSKFCEFAIVKPYCPFVSRKRCGLTENGVIVFKDNLSSQQESEFDCEDNSWTRPEPLVRSLFERAGLRVVAENLQTGFPAGMYKVKMFALKPERRSAEKESS